MEKKDLKKQSVPSSTMSEEEKAKKAALKAQRKAEYEAKFKKEQEQKINQNSADVNKSKSELKAERRAKQEAQRAAKQQQQQPTKPKQQSDQKSNQNKSTGGQQQPQKSSSSSNQQVPSTTTVDPNTTSLVLLKKQDSIISSNNKDLPDRILIHLPRKATNLKKLSTESIPDSIIKIGYRINKDLITDSTTRCITMLMAFHSITETFQPKIDFKRELQQLLFETCFDFLNKCRPLSISMINSIKHLKSIFSRPKFLLLQDDQQIRSELLNSIEQFINDEILCSRQAISDHALKTIFSINENQTILTLGYSTIMKKIFKDAQKNGIKFKVVVVDCRPRFEGRKMVKFLTELKIPVTYLLINAILYIMKEVNKVLFEAHSVLCNGYVMSTIGSSQIALVAQAYNVPVVVCCETFKYSDRAYTDSFTHNELGDSMQNFLKEQSSASLDSDGSSDQLIKNLTFLDLFYDLTPREFISAVITEKGLLPCTSVPAILRFREQIK